MHNDTKEAASRRLFCADDAVQMARRRMPRMMFDFVMGAAGSEVARRLNRSELEAIRLQPRVLVNVEGGSLAKKLLEQEMGLPFGIAPMGMCNLAWPGADRMLATEARERKIPLCVSTAASTTLEDMAELSDGQAWFQLYAGQSQDAALELVRRAGDAGYKNLILTVDVPVLSRRIRDLRNGFQVPFRIGPRQFVDFCFHPGWSISTLLQGVPSPKNYGPSGFVRDESRARTDWDFLDLLRDRWQGNLIVKGVTSCEDAERIKAAGADAIYVSNHGGRQLDSAPPAICTLGPIRQAVGPGFPLIFDSGVQSGEDVVKALAMGADFVMIGRSMLFAIGADGHRGLTTLIDLVAEDIGVTLAQLGLKDVTEVSNKSLYVRSGNPSGDS